MPVITPGYHTLLGGVLCYMCTYWQQFGGNLHLVLVCRLTASSCGLLTSCMLLATCPTGILAACNIGRNSFIWYYKPLPSEVFLYNVRGKMGIFIYLLGHGHHAFLKLYMFFLPVNLIDDNAVSLLHNACPYLPLLV